MNCQNITYFTVTEKPLRQVRILENPLFLPLKNTQKPFKKDRFSAKK